MTDTSTAAVERLDNILETHFDTQRSVEQDPYGATEAIENALLMIRALSAQLEAANQRHAAAIEAVAKVRDVALDDVTAWLSECDRIDEPSAWLCDEINANLRTKAPAEPAPDYTGMNADNMFGDTRSLPDVDQLSRDAWAAEPAQTVQEAAKCQECHGTGYCDGCRCWSCYPAGTRT